MDMDHRDQGRNYNCRGCGARITDHRCPYCNRPITPELGDTITPDPEKDPKRNITPRKVFQ